MKTIEYPKIGKGMFSTVYRKDARTVLIKSVDPVKECMSLGWFPKTAMFPTVKRLLCEDDFSLYECRYYHKVSSLKKSLTRFEYEFYLAL
ncbi:hypothetical protein JZU68_02215, partial [bacterium]|nr:hypothetical protein [bacterium]